MDKLTNIVRDEISRQYKSVRQFAFAVGIPLSTINSALHNGIGGSSFDTVVQICRTLGICALGEENIHLTEDTQRILDQYTHRNGSARLFRCIFRCISPTRARTPASTADSTIITNSTA